MIHLYTWTTPNGRKIPIMLEEIGMPYEVHPININQNEQFAAWQIERPSAAGYTGGPRTSRSS